MCVESPADAIAAGIGMVHQRFISPARTRHWTTSFSARNRSVWGDRSTTGAHPAGITGPTVGLAVDWDAAIEDLPVGVQQRVEILKLLYRDARILILDEPTAVLTPQETNELFRNLKKLRDEGKTIILITHKLKEVMSFTDHVTVFRAGKVTGEMPTAQTNPQELANLMVGRKVVLNINVSPAHARDELAMEVAALSLSGTVAGAATNSRT